MDTSKPYFDEPHSIDQLRKMFSKYNKSTRFKFLNRKIMSSYDIQFRQICNLFDNDNKNTVSVLEVGPGAGFTGTILKFAGFNYKSLDGQADNNPDIVSDLRTFNEKPYIDSFDIVASFQTLEHIEYDEALVALSKFKSISRKYVFISIPHHCLGIGVNIKLNLFKNIRSTSVRKFGKKIGKGGGFNWVFNFRNSQNRKYRPEFVNEFPYAIHYWELGRNKITIKKFKDELKNLGFTIVRNFNNPEYPYHHFFLLQVK